MLCTLCIAVPKSLQADLNSWDSAAGVLLVEEVGWVGEQEVKRQCVTGIASTAHVEALLDLLLHRSLDLFQASYIKQGWSKIPHEGPYRRGEACSAACFAFQGL